MSVSSSSAARLLGRHTRELAGSVIGVVGSGGKTATISHLAAELSEQFSRILICTTTRAYPFPDVPTVLKVADLPDAFSSNPVVFLGKSLGDDGKVRGEQTPNLDDLRRRADLILIEGDGARRRPLKVHLPHDPVLPPDCDLALLVVGASVLAAPASTSTVHRLERAPAAWGLVRGQKPSAGVVARILFAADGYARVVGRSALRVVINQADDWPRQAEALRQEVNSLWPGGVLTGSAKQGRFELDAATSLLVLAAGSASRFGRDKLALDLCGKTVLSRTLAAHGAADFCERLIVLRPGDKAGRDCASRHGFRVVSCPNAAEGMSASLRCGLAAISRGADNLLLALGDLPAVRPATVESLLAATSSHPERGIRPVCRGRAGHPVLFPASAFTALGKLRGDRGARDIIAGLDPFLLDVDDCGTILDLDRADDLDELTKLCNEENSNDV